MTVRVTAPGDDRGDAIVDAYKRILDERGFHFGRYLDGPSVVMLTRHTGNDCDVMIFGLPYLPPDQRTHLLYCSAASPLRKSLPRRPHRSFAA